MVDYTTPVTTTFELQRKSIEQSQQALQQTIEVQQRFAGAVVDSLDSTEQSQRRLVEVQRDALHNTLDAVEANVPGETNTEDIRATLDEQYDLLLENHAEAFEGLADGLEEGVATYDELTDDYLDALDEQIAMLVEAHEELETQSVEAVQQLADQVEQLQTQLEEMQHQVQDASEQVVEA